MVEALIEVIEENHLPDAFTDLLGGFVVQENSPREHEGAPTFQDYLNRRLTQKYPLLDPNAFRIKRSILLKPDRDLIQKLKEASNKSLESIMHLVASRYGPPYFFDSRTKKVLAVEGFERPRVNLPKFNLPEELFIELPLFAVSAGKAYNTNGVIYGNTTLNLQICNDKKVENSSLEITKLHLRHPVHIHVKTPIAPEEIRDAVPEAFSDYYQAVGESVSKLRLKKSPEIAQPDIKILWVPSTDSLNIEVIKPRPAYRDPALLMQCGCENYVIGLWDIEKGETVNIESLVGEWTSGSFKWVKDRIKKRTYNPISN